MDKIFSLRMTVRVLLSHLLLMLPAGSAQALQLSLPPNDCFIEAESFEHLGGWVLDNQAASIMGSPYLLAHGLGVPVEDASTQFDVNRSYHYRLWVRTRDWTRTWGRTESPGRFQVLLNGVATDSIFGTRSEAWNWQDGGIVFLKSGKNTIALHDLTGFDGRCDAIYLTPDLTAAPPVSDQDFRRRKLHLPKAREEGTFDLVVVGGGIAGCCAAVTAARLGCRVALIQNRPVLGGNNSSEVRVGLSGLIRQQPYPHLGELLDELGGVGHWTHYEAQQDPNSERSQRIMSILRQHPEKMQHNAGPASNYEDEKKLKLIQAEPNITLFLSTEVVGVKMHGTQIQSVVGRNIATGHEHIFRGRVFADCTGDGNLGYLAGADFRIGRESRAETGEPSAPVVGDRLMMGTSVQWYSEDALDTQSFPECPWAIQFTDTTCFPILRGDWQWETGLDRDQITDIERIRDHALRAVYGNWAYLKNHYARRDTFMNKRLVWVAHIGGKRESRRLMGDVILSEQDLKEHVPYEDASFTTTWSIDLHYPEYIPGIAESPFTAYSRSTSISPYAVPYRCLYSRNVDNMFMAGRNISVTHIALGTVRVMRTGGMMGEVVGMAAYLCQKHKTLPRAVYTDHLAELKRLMEKK